MTKNRKLRETESLLIATQNNVIRNLCVKVRIHKTPANSKS